MKFLIHRKLENNIFNTKVVFKEFGGKDLEPAQEKELINDFGSPKINYAEIDFKGNVSKNDGKITVGEDGEEISFVLNAKTLQIDESFKAELSVSPKKLGFVTVGKDEEETVKTFSEVSEEEDEDSLNEIDIAEAVCLIFEEKIREAIEDKLKELKDLYTSFEEETPIEFTV